ncbi:MAG: alpha/beta hydrolase [Rhodospirillaceae bacterium]|nr:alpha/beta hydrolase [Rhodospirillaceae bacterium]MDD9927105.1 alpha/beta hydrolase [Rhodospirillaceae bacterium]
MASAALEKLIAAKRANPYRPDKSVEELRAESEARAAEPLPEGTVCETVDADGVAAEWVSGAGSSAERTFLFIHGGGYYRGSPASSRAATSRLSAATGARVLSTSYRLAPENAFPAAIDDVYTVYRWMLAQGVDAGTCMVGGISAGGGLTLALLLKLKAAGDPLPAGAVPMSAWTDLTQSSETFQSKADIDPTISKHYLDRMAEAYLAGADPKTPLASPLYGDLSGLPPMLVQVGTAETMYDDSRLYAEKAQAAGVDITFEPWEDMIHGWHGSAAVLPEAQEAIDSVGAYFRSRIP